MRVTLVKREREIYIQGAAVSEGIAIGLPYFLKPIEEEVPDFEISVNEVDAEIARYRFALSSSKKDLNLLRQDLAMEGSEEAMNLIESHIQILDDPMITSHMEGKIRQMLRNTESVFRSVIKDYEYKFSERTNAFFNERLIDVKDISKRILGHLRDKQNAQLQEIPSGSIILTEEIAPSYTASAHAAQIGAFVTKLGGGNSHAALIARAKGIPYIANIEVEGLEEYLNEEIIVDGYEGVLIVNPTSSTREKYLEKQRHHATRYQRFLEEDSLTSETLDGYPIRLCVNVGNPHDLTVFPYKHDGVGLFRTEYLFLQTKEFYPSEDYQEEAYKQLIDQIKGRPVVIRVFDLGGDKNPGLFFDRREPNPILGFRGIRFLLRHLQLFRTQLRAIFKAAIDADVHLLLPLISDINELEQSKKLIHLVREELLQEGVLVPELPIGCMIEVPSAVMICEALADQCDFFSIGTNDLTQYTLGIDRSNPGMNELFYPAHPSVLRMIKMLCVETARRDMPIAICGEIASNTLFTPLLIGLGLRELSVSPRYLPLVKQTVRKWTMVEAYALAEKALKMTNPKEISALLTEVQRI